MLLNVALVIYVVVMLSIAVYVLQVHYKERFSKMSDLLKKFWPTGPPKIVVCRLDDNTQEMLIGLNDRSIFIKDVVEGNSQGIQELIALSKEILDILKNKLKSNVSGGMIFRIGATMNPIQPGNTVKFLVAPTFTGAPFTLVGANAAVVSSDPDNFPVNIDLSDDPTGATFEAAIPSTAAPVGGQEDITVTWSYTNADGIVAQVKGTVTELGIVDDVTGGTFQQVA